MSGYRALYGVVLPSVAGWAAFAAVLLGIGGSDPSWTVFGLAGGIYLVIQFGGCVLGNRLADRRELPHRSAE